MLIPRIITAILTAEINNLFGALYRIVSIIPNTKNGIEMKAKNTPMPATSISSENA